jgi:threonine/homoserine/homoserine lactone efflux protein
MLAFSNAARFGFNHAMLGAFGRLVAFGLMITLVAVGLGALLAASETAFTIVKWLGAAYLV